MRNMHTPEQLRLLSNVGHWIEGGILAIVGVVALIQAFSDRTSGPWIYLWPGFVLVAGVTLALYLLLHHGGDVGTAWRFVTSDPQQRQHLGMAVLLSIAGAAETAYHVRTVSTPALLFVWPAVLIVIGVLFTIHTQHGTSDAVTWAARVHRYLGIVLITAGVSRAAEILYANDAAWLRFVWPAMLLVAALLLIAYREPQGAYERGLSADKQSHGGH